MVPRQSRSQSFVPLDQRSENESSGYHCAVSVCIYFMLWRMPEMVAPRALVFRPLVKGNEALGTRLVPRLLAPVRAMRSRTCVDIIQPCR